MCFFAVAAQAATLGPALEALAGPTMAGNAEEVAGAEVRFGNAVFRLDGEIEAVLAAEARVGFAFKGSGRMALSLEPGPFLQANLTTVRDDLPGSALDGTTVVREFDGGVFFTNRVPDSLFGGEDVTSTRLADVLTRSLERWAATRYTGIDHLLAPFVLDDPGAPVVVAILWNGGDDTLYIFDPVEERQELYGRLKRADGGSGGSFQYLDLSVQQPAEHDPRVRPTHRLVQTAIDLTLVSRDNENAVQTTTTTVQAGAGPVRLLAFSLMNGRSETGRAWDDHEFPITVSGVTDAAGKGLEFSHRYDQLLVLLPEPLAAGAEATITVVAEGGFLKNFSGDNYLVLGNMPYLPQLDVHATAATFHSVVKVSEPFVPLATGRTVRRWTEDGLNCVESREDRPTAFPFVIVGKFVVSDKQEAGYDVRVYSYASAKERGARNLIRNGLAILDFYSNGMEPFPYGELEVIEIPYYRHFFWQAPAGLVEITSEGLSPLSGDASDLNTIIKRYASKGQNSRYAHEIAHQWFGNLVSWGTPYDNWLSESFAEYLAYLFMSEGAKDKAKAKVQLNEWETDTKECSEFASIYGATALNGTTRHQQCYTQLLYGKGPYVLHALRQEIGDATFKKLLYFLTVQAAKKPGMKVITEDLIQFVNALTNKDYRPWFDRYVYGTEVPPKTW
ncbi:MAG TPA: M1 family aminopeptidase [Candidatus Sulfomarinibacteraceae bacterium]|nr:M1 family aminopeptidase [Candidatus Sulfomarinibacteraceae bacterium]